MNCKKEVAFEKIFYDVAETLVTLDKVPWEKVNKILSFCPQTDSNDRFVIYYYSLDCLIALGTYFIKSNLQHEDKILPYLLKLLKGLENAIWPAQVEISGFLFPERFSFCLNTLLSDVSSRCDYGIIFDQVNEIPNLAYSIYSDILNKNEESRISENIYQIKIPVFLGLCQSFSKYKVSKKSYFCFCFPKYKNTDGIVYHLKNLYDIKHINVFPQICTEEISKSSLSDRCYHKFEYILCSYPENLIIKVIDAIELLLNKHTLSILNVHLEKIKDINVSCKTYLCNNLNELLISSCVILLKDILYNQMEISTTVAERVHGILEDFNPKFQIMYVSTLEDYAAFNAINEFMDIDQNKLKMYVLINVICKELEQQLILDDNLAEILCLQVVKKLKAMAIKSKDKYLIIESPVVITYLGTLGTMAEKYPQIWETSVSALADFLTSPSLILLNLYNKQFTDIKHENKMNEISIKRDCFIEHCIYKRIQNCCVENLCKSLKSANTINSNYIPAFVTSFSRFLFIDRNHTYHSLITECVVVALGHISNYFPSFTNTILKCFLHKFRRHSVDTDIAIIIQLGNTFIFNKNTEVRNKILKTFCDLIIEVNFYSTADLTSISVTLYHTLRHIINSLEDESLISQMFIRFLEIFVQIGIENRLLLMSSIKSELVTQHDRLLYIIALLSEKFKLDGCSKQQRVFQEFWLYLITEKDSLILDIEYDQCLKKIAPKLPTLTSELLTDCDFREKFYLTLFTEVSPAKQSQLKSHAVNYLQNSPEITAIINKLAFPHIMYIHSVSVLETIRIEGSENPNFEYIFTYLNNSKLQKDKYGMWQCMLKVSEEIFNRFLKNLSEKPRNDLRECILEKHTQLLLIHFNNINSQVRHLSDKLLSNLIVKFPHLLWNRTVLWSMLDMLIVLFYSLQINSTDKVTSLRLPNTSYSINLTSSNKMREEIFNDFVARGQEILLEAKKWAPEIVSSHLQEYALQEVHGNGGVDSFWDLKNHVWTLLCSSSEKSKLDLSDVMLSLTVRSRYVGEVSGLLEKSAIPSVEFGKILSEAVWIACTEHSLTKYKNALLRLTAFAAKQNFVQYEVCLALATSHLKFFTEEAMSTVVKCWLWLCTVNAHFELELLQEIFYSWKFTMNNCIGVFSKQVYKDCYDIMSSCEKQDQVTQNSEPHNIWAAFVSEVVESIKYSNQAKFDTVLYFLHSTLPLCTGEIQCTMNKFIENIPARFLLLTSGLSLLQSAVQMTMVNKLTLRQRIYSTCLDYFCYVRTFPLRKGKYLKYNIEILIKFWQVLYSDKKHLNNTSLINEVNKGRQKQKDLKTTTTQKVISENRNSKELKHSNSIDQSCKQLNQLNEQSLQKLHKETLPQHFIEDFLKKRKIALCLIAEEIEFLTTWLNPSSKPELIIDGEQTILSWKAKIYHVEKAVRDIARIAWDISPVLAVFLPLRFKYEESMILEISENVLSNPHAVSHIPHAMQYLATTDAVNKDHPALVNLFVWSECTPTRALALLSPNFPDNPITVQFAKNVLLNCDVSSLIFFIPQMVQSLRSDSLGHVCNLLKTLSSKNQLFCHQLIWNLKANMYEDIIGTQKSSIFDQLKEVFDFVMENLSGPEKVFYDREFTFVDKITDVSGKIPKNLKYHERKAACIKALKEVKVELGCYLPSNPESLIFDINYNSGIPLQSKTRTPFLADFLVARCTFDKVNEVGMMVSQKQLDGIFTNHIEIKDPQVQNKIWQPTIFKVGDDMRQDVLALQLIQIFQNIFKAADLDLFVFPYRVVVIAPGMGVIECIPNASSRDQLGKKTNVKLYNYFITTFGDEQSDRFREAQRNFVRSVAAYSVINFLLQIKDRHNGNIMVDSKGHIMHIDFGFMFESSPGGNLGFEPDMKLTEEMVMIMGGKMDAEPFQWFMELCIKAYLAARPYHEHIIALVSSMLDSGLPCFRGNTIKLLKSRFAVNASEREAAAYIISVIRRSFLNFRTVTYDVIQYLQNSIQY